MNIENLKGADAIIVSAGLGKRMGGSAGGPKKNFLILNGRPVLVHTLLPFESCALVENVVIVTSQDDIEYCRNQIVERYGLKKVLAVIAGGKERQDSVRAGLDFLETEGLSDKMVIIHDGARCLVTTGIIERTLSGAKKNDAAAAMVQVTDTIKESTEEGSFALRTLSRERLYAVQTPQAFKGELIKRAMDTAIKDGFIGTDSSSLVERLGEKVLIVEGSYENIKITTEEDLHLAERLLQAREEKEKVGQ